MRSWKKFRFVYLIKIIFYRNIWKCYGRGFNESKKRCIHCPLRDTGANDYTWAPGMNVEGCYEICRRHPRWWQSAGRILTEKEMHQPKAMGEKKIIEVEPDKHCKTCHGRGRMRVHNPWGVQDKFCGCVEQRARKKAAEQKFVGTYLIKIKMTQVLQAKGGNTVEAVIK